MVDVAEVDPVAVTVIGEGETEAVVAAACLLWSSYFPFIWLVLSTLVLPPLSVKLKQCSQQGFSYE
jgi:hypothetical protein